MKIKIPKSYEVQPLKPGEEAIERATCGDCGLSWDDGRVTGITPTPAGRCPFEAFHRYPLAKAQRAERERARLKADAAQLARAIAAFDRRCSKAEYTDTGEAWELLTAARKLLRRMGK